MWDILDKFSPGQFIGLVATVFGILGWVITVVAAQWRRVRVAEMEAALKQQMMERGMNAAEIQEVLRASKKSDWSCGKSAGSSPKARMVKALADNGYEGKDIERILRTFGTHPDRELVVQKEGADRADAFGRALAAKVEIVEMMAANGNETEEIERVLGAYKDDAPWRMEERQPVAVRG